MARWITVAMLAVTLFMSTAATFSHSALASERGGDKGGQAKGGDNPNGGDTH